MGVTSVGSTGPQAWLVNIDNGARERGVPGDQVFGFTLKAVDDHAVLLSRGDDEWEIELGERSLPAATVTLASESIDTGGGSSRSDMRARMMERMSRMGGSSPSSDRGSRGSGYSGSRYSSGGSSYSGGRSSSRGLSSSRPSSSSMRSSSSARVLSSGSSGGNWSRGNTRSRNSAATQVTSNPQAARRQGARLVGDSAPLPTPRVITNPQTERRRGSTGATGALSQNGGERSSGSSGR